MGWRHYFCWLDVAIRFNAYTSHAARGGLESQGFSVVFLSIKTIGLFRKRALQNRRYSAKETYNFLEPTFGVGVSTQTHTTIVQLSFLGMGACQAKYWWFFFKKGLFGSAAQVRTLKSKSLYVLLLWLFCKKNTCF